MNNLSKDRLRLVTNNNYNLVINPEKTSALCIEEEVWSQILHAYNNRLMARRLKPSSIKANMRTISNFFEYTGLYPCQWTSEDFDDWSAYLYSIKKNGEATQRSKQRMMARFQSFLIESPKITKLCEHHFAVKPMQICSELNLIPHKVEDENKEKRMAFTKEQLQCLWNYFDEEIALAYKNQSKSFKVLQRDKVMYLIIYYYGLRANETSMLNTTDFIHNPKRTEWESFGGIVVKHGKASAGSPPKRRIVWTISDISVEYLRWYIENVRPQFGFDDNEALFLSERGNRLSPKSITRNFKDHLKSAGLPTKNYSTHCLRHSYISHLSENCNLSPRFIQEQVGHSYLATTQLYTHLSDAFVRKQLNNVIDRQLIKLQKGR
ncbi:tyrosine-type recombinase/integrase [Wukongibacter sp. M2B1]|uniref:tyrosine-type recombinase/integrase n=1 Tax=Wukongibacter sp. M2B1 TaxID=3088895 RepID=UPI003D79B300